MLGIGSQGCRAHKVPLTDQTWPKDPLHQRGNNRLCSAPRWGRSTPSARVRRATSAARAWSVAPSALWAWDERRSPTRDASTGSVHTVVRRYAWDILHPAVDAPFFGAVSATGNR